ncbi:MAG: hypothetical protein J5858_11880 [Lentisphaeria bacterium]|nr:hypothetical protein [Lentisphaeria bacterium]
MMIEQGGGTVNVLYADGTSASFDPEELRVRLERSFAASGRTDSWAAEEIVLTVEYALRCRALDGEFGPAVHAEDIDNCVVRILEDSGYPEVAGHFRLSQVTSGDFGTLSPDEVETYLTQKLQLTGPDGAELTAKIRQAMTAIGAMRCSPRLILELARHFRDRAASARRLPVPPPIKKAEAVKPPDGEEKIMQFHRSDTGFPSIRAEINLVRMMEKCPLEPPLTELSLIPILSPAAEQLDRGYRNLRCCGAENYPLILTLRNFSEFALKWLCYEPDMTKEILKKRGRAFVSCFTSLLQEKPFKTFLR